MKNNTPVNLFFTYEINYIKLFVITLTLLISTATLADGKHTIFSNSLNSIKLLVTPIAVSDSNNNVLIVNSTKLYINNNIKREFFLRIDYGKFEKLIPLNVVEKFYYRNFEYFNLMLK
jgi:hypothetical protein